MRQISIKQLRSATAENIQDWLPFEIVSDGVAIACVYDVALAKAFSTGQIRRGHDVALPELKFSKASQAKGQMGHDGAGWGRV